MLGVFQESVFAIGEIAADLFHPRGIRTRRDPGNVDATGFQMHHGENVERHQSVPRPDFDSREVRGEDRISVGLQRLMNFNPEWNAFAGRLKKKGKPHNVVVAAVANRWLRRLYHQMQPDQLVAVM
jgi:hypothetical protein